MKKSILVVDDDAQVRGCARDALQRARLDVLEAYDGVVAVELFRSFSDRIGLVLMDLEMPRMNGEEALRRMQALQPEVRVIICSGYPPELVRARFDGKGCRGFLPKPYRLHELIARAKQDLLQDPEDEVSLDDRVWRRVG